jgi:preprotein translocase subunit SecA
VPHQVLNAKIMREAFTSPMVKGAITVATNIAGRGVDIV